MTTPDVAPDWLPALEPVLATPSSSALRSFLGAQLRDGVSIHPDKADWFAAFRETPLASVKVVILGQDPYPTPGNAHGLSFSVRPGVRTPASLQNIQKEIRDDLGVAVPRHGNLLSWARQGVLLLNSSLTVRSGEPGSHRNQGWEPVTDAAIRAVSARETPAVFMLWGRHAREKAALVDRRRHLVLEAAHPSPMSVGGFSGCRHFSKANAFLESKGETPIDWSLPARPVD